MLESGIDRIISQVVDPKINHIFRPQVEKAVHEFLATLNHKEETSPSTAQPEEKADASLATQGVSAATPSASVASDAMSILETITSLNQEASAARASTEIMNSKAPDRTSRKLSSQQSVDGGIERERNAEDLLDGEKLCNSAEESADIVTNGEEVNSFSSAEEGKIVPKEVPGSTNPSKDVVQEGEEPKSRLADRKPESSEKGERKKEKKEKLDKKSDHLKKNDDILKTREEKAAKETELSKHSAGEKNSSKHRATESTKDLLEDSDTEILSDITVSSVHTSDLSSFEEESEEELVLSDSTEEGEIVSDDEEEEPDQIKTRPETGDASDKKTKSGRHSYVHKPYLYSKYYSDSDDERTVEQRRQSVAKEKEERLLRRQLNREKLEERRKQKAAEKTRTLKTGNQGKSSQNVEESLSRGLDLKAGGASIKDVLKEKRFLEKKVALSRKRRRESRHNDEGGKKKYEQPEEDIKEPQKTNESGEKLPSKEVKATQGKTEAHKLVRRLSESIHATEESRNDIKVEREHKRKTSTSLQLDGAQHDTEVKDPKPHSDRAEANQEEFQKQKNILKNEKHIKKEDSEPPNFKSVLKKDIRSSKEKNEKERTVSEDKPLTKHKYKGDGVHRTGDEAENLSSEKSLKGEESVQKHNQLTKTLSGEQKNKHRSERKASASSKEVKNVSEPASKNEEGSHKENNRKYRHISTEKSRGEHKCKKSSSDSRPQKESQSASKTHSSATSRRSGSCLEDKDRHDTASVNLDSALRQGDSIHKDRRKSKSILEERLSMKSKFKSHSKQAKKPESELPESSSKHESGQKSEKEKNAEEVDLDKHYKSKGESRILEDSSVELESESGVPVISSSQKDSGHRVKLQLAEKSSTKEKTKSERDFSSSRLERKLSTEGHKTKSLKHSSKEIRKRDEENKAEDRGVKQTVSHARVAENNQLADKKASKRFAGENKKGILSSQDMDMGEEKIPAVRSAGITFPVSQNVVCDTLHSEQSQESTDTELQRTLSESCHQTSQAEEKSSHDSQETKFKTAAKEQTHHNSVYECNKSENSKERTSGPFLSSHINSEQKDKNASKKEEGEPRDRNDQSLNNVGPIKRDPYHVIACCETSDQISLSSHKDKEKLNFQGTSEDLAALNTSKNIVDPTMRSSREEVNNLSEITNPLVSVSMEESLNLDTPSAVSDNKTEDTVKIEQRGTVTQASNVDGGTVNDITMNSKGEASSLSGEQAAEENVNIQESLVQGSARSVAQNNRLTDLMIIGGCIHTDESESAILEKAERENPSEGSSGKEDKPATERKDQTEEQGSAGAVTESSSGKNIAKGGGANAGGFADDKNETNVVGSSVGGGSYDTSRSMEASDATMIGTSTERSTGSLVTATSMGESRGEGSSSVNLQREGDAVISCSEEKGKATLICTSIEADEGFHGGVWAENKQGPRFATEKDYGECTVTAAEESGAGVTEGLAACESSSTSTKEEDGDECTANYAEESGQQLSSKGGMGLQQNLDNVETEEKDDAVTSAGSEGRCTASASRGTSRFDSATTCVSEVEGDGAVTSAGTADRNGSLHGESPDEFQTTAGGTGQVKAVEGAVTCTGAARGGLGFAICSVTGTDSPGDSAVTEACARLEASNTVTGTHADKSEDVVYGESAVTSTGITAEDDPEAAAACPGLEDSNEGFSVSLSMQEKYEQATDSTEAAAETNVTEVSRGSCDDEGFVTSTGAKEDDEEGEDFVTSTGRGNEELDHASAFTGTEAAERSALCVGDAESGNSSICRATSQLGTELGMLATDAGKGTVDSLTSFGEETKGGSSNHSTKGIVESSTTTVGSGNENVMGFIIEKEETSANTETYEIGTISETLEQSTGPPSAMEEKNEDATSYLDNKKGDGLAFRMEEAVPSASEDDEVEAETISTSVVKVCPSPPRCSSEHTEQTSAENSDQTTRISGEEFEAPMPSTAVDRCQSQGGAITPSKVSTSVLEEFEAPMPSATTEERGSQFATGQAVETTSTNVEVHAVPAPSASRGEANKSCTADQSQEERDECTVISTSINEELEVPLSHTDTEDLIPPFAFGLEHPARAAVISTSSAEHLEISLSPATTQELNSVSDSRTERRLESFSISTSAAEGALMLAKVGEKGDSAIVCSDATEEGKAVQSSDATGQESERAVQSTSKITQGATVFVEEETKCDAPGQNVAIIKHDPQLVALNIENPEVIATVAARVVEECDSASNIPALEETPPAFESTEVDDERSVVCAEASDHSVSSAPEEGQDVSAVLCEGSLSFSQEEPDVALTGESAAFETAEDTKKSETTANVEKSSSGGENLGTEICLDDSPSADISVLVQEGVLRNEVTSSPCDRQSEQETGDNKRVTDNINPDSVLKTDLSGKRDFPQGEYLAPLLYEPGSDSEKGALTREMELCTPRRLADVEAQVGDGRDVETAFQESIEQHSDNEEVLPVVPEEQELQSQLMADEERPCKSPMKENQQEENHKAPDASDSIIVTEAVKVQFPEEKSLELQVEIPDQEEERRDRLPATGQGDSDGSSEAQTLGEKAEASQSIEAEQPAEDIVPGDSGKGPEGAVEVHEPSLDSVEEKDNTAGKVDICEKPDLEPSLNPVEENQPVIIKRKRGRPRKYPLPGQVSEADPGAGKQSSSPKNKEKISPKVENVPREGEEGHEAEAGKTEVVVRRRGRKPKRPLIPSLETGTDTPEPDRKRQRFIPAAEEETKDQEDSKGGREDSEDDDHSSGGGSKETPAGATTRSASRLEAQRKQPSKPTTRAATKNQSPGPVSPTNHQTSTGKKAPAHAKPSKSSPVTLSRSQPTKRKREGSPPGSLKKGHLRTEEAAAKKAKR